MVKTKSSTTRRFVRLLGSPACFRLVLILLIVQAVWIALSGRYAMAFDEDFHLGIIRLYAQHASPFWGTQAPGGGTFGAVARDPSYLYQFLMAVPYRVIKLFTGDQTVQVLWLRAINIGLFAGGVALYRRLMLKIGLSTALVQACLLVFVLLPVVPLLAAQINYDNLLLPLTAVALLLTIKLEERLTRQRRLDAKVLLQLLVICLLTCLVKYAFLPVFAAITGFVAVRVWQTRSSLSGRWFGLVPSWRQLGKGVQTGLAVSVVVAAGLFAERYVVNVVRYHALVPDCSQVLSIKQCRQYGPWIRDYNFKLNKLDTDAKASPLTFTTDWFYGMWLRLFFAVDGPANDFQTRGPLIMPGVAGMVFAVAGAVALLFSAPRLLKKYGTPVGWLFVAVILSYGFALWLDELQAFIATAQPVAINGRYLLPILPLVFLLIAAAIRELVTRPALKAAIAGVAIVSLLWGGGALTYILRSNNAWYWPNPAIRHLNYDVQRTLGPVTPGYGNPVLFMY